VKDKDEKGKVSIEIAWKHRPAAKASDLRVEARPRFA